MTIKNFCPSLKNKQINYYLSKLPEVYRTCDIPIIFVPDNYIGFLILKYYIKEYYLGELTYPEFNNCGGTHYYRNEKSVMIHVKNKHKVAVPFILFHELRHWYQRTYLINYMNKVYYNYDNNILIKDYHKQPIEKDANVFAKKYCKELGIKFKQSITNGYTLCAKSSKLKELK
jgi:hypothetical protein